MASSEAPQSPPLETFMPDSVVPEVAPEDIVAAAAEAAQKRQDEAYQHLADFMISLSTLSEDELRVQPRSFAPKPTPVYPTADKWGAAAHNLQPYNEATSPSTRSEARHSMRQHKAKSQLGALITELSLEESGVYKIDSETGKSLLRDSEGKLDHLDPATRRSVTKTEKRYKKTQDQKEKYLNVLEPLEPSLQNIREQTGKDDLSGLSWNEKQGDKQFTRRIVEKKDDGRYAIESPTASGDIVRYLKTEEELETYLKANYSKLSNFLMAPGTGENSSNSANSHKVSPSRKERILTRVKGRGARTVKKISSFTYQGAREMGKLYAAPQELAVEDKNPDATTTVGATKTTARTKFRNWQEDRRNRKAATTFSTPDTDGESDVNLDDLFE